jgi:hypothetical protein
MSLPASNFLKPEREKFRDDDANKKAENEMYSRFWGFFMAEGWEPFAASRTSTYSSQAYFFRRKFIGRVKPINE